MIIATDSKNVIKYIGQNFKYLVYSETALLIYMIISAIVVSDPSMVELDYLIFPILTYIGMIFINMHKNKELTFHFRVQCQTCFKLKYKNEMVKFVEETDLDPKLESYICKNCINVIKKTKIHKNIHRMK